MPPGSTVRGGHEGWCWEENGQVKDDGRELGIVPKVSGWVGSKGVAGFERVALGDFWIGGMVVVLVDYSVVVSCLFFSWVSHFQWNWPELEIPVCCRCRLHQRTSLQWHFGVDWRVVWYCWNCAVG